MSGFMSFSLFFVGNGECWSGWRKEKQKIYIQSTSCKIQSRNIETMKKRQFSIFEKQTEDMYKVKEKPWEKVACNPKAAKAHWSSSHCIDTPQPHPTNDHHDHHQFIIITIIIIIIIELHQFVTRAQSHGMEISPSISSSDVPLNQLNLVVHITIRFKWTKQT